MSSNLYHRINELVEEVRSLKSHNERLRTRARLAEDRATRLANENSSLKFAAAAQEARDIIDAQPVPTTGRMMYPPSGHPTMQLGGVVAE